MSSINFSDTTPGAPAGGVNLKWQTDDKGNISAYASKADITGGLVSSVFGRTGDVVAAAGDYNAGQVLYAVDQRVSYANPMWLASLDYSKLTNVPANVGAVSSVFGRTGAVVAQAGDYTAAQVTNAVSTAGSYADPAWITSLSASKLTGAPPAAVIAASQTPWLQNVNAAGYQLQGAGSIGIGTSSVTSGYLLEVYGSMNLHDWAEGYFISAQNSSKAGMYMPSGAIDLRFQTSAADRLCITSAGNVGIGTTAPADVLDVNGRIHLKFASGTGAGIWLDSSSATNQCFVGSDPSANIWRVYSSVIPGNCVTVNLASGNVGIGTTAPSKSLDVLSGSAIAAIFSSTGSAGAVGIGSNSGASIIQAYTDHTASGGAALCLQTSGGNVGIGTTAPATALDVTGSIRATGSIEFDTNLSMNVFYNGSTWVARQTGSGLMVQGTGTQNGVNNVQFYAFPVGNAGAGVTGIEMLQFNTNGSSGFVSVPSPLCLQLTSGAPAYLESLAPNVSLWCYMSAVNSAVTWHLKGSDGVVRSFTMNFS